MLVLAFCLLAFSAGGCAPKTEAQYRFLTFFFDGVPKPGEAPKPKARRRVRRPPPAPEVRLAMVEVKPLPRPERPKLAAEKLHDWDKVAELFPKSPEENADWMAALEKEMIAPRKSLDAEGELPPAEEIEDIVYSKVVVKKRGKHKGKKKLVKTVFPHNKHYTWLTCTNCHPDPFPETRGGIQMAKKMIRKGEYCGLCHRAVAFDTEECDRCHPPKKGG